MPRLPVSAEAFQSHWRIVQTDVWDADVLDLAEPAHIAFDRQGRGELALPP